jgi:ribonuclease P protein subunit POP4
MSSKERKNLGLFDIPSSLRSFELYLPLHFMWKEYFGTVVGTPKNENAETMKRWLKFDYHGCFFTVVKSRNPSLLGIKGILVKETAKTMQLITCDDKLRVIPKDSTIIGFVWKEKQILLHTQYLQHRSEDRSVRKYKAQETIDLL